MFELKYRIENEYDRLKAMTTEEFNDDFGIDALFQFSINGYDIGYYHEDELDSQEIGAEYVTDWFGLLLEASIKLKTHNNVSIAISGWGETWLNFKKQGEKLFLSLIEKKLELNKFTPSVNSEEFTNYKVLDFENEEITFEEFNREIIKKTRVFLKELIKINNSFKDSFKVREYSSFIDEILKD